MRRVGEAQDLEVRVGEFLLGKEDLTKQIATNRGAFTVRIPDPITKQAIITNIAQTVGASLDALPASDYAFIAAMHTLPRVLSAWPDWWEGVHVCYDEDLIFELFRQFQEFETAFRRCLRAGRSVQADEASGLRRLDHRQVQSAPDGEKVPEAKSGTEAAPAKDGRGASRKG